MQSRGLMRNKIMDASVQGTLDYVMTHILNVQLSFTIVFRCYKFLSNLDWNRNIACELLVQKFALNFRRDKNCDNPQDLTN